MEQFKLGEMEQRFAELIWAEAPIASGQLAKRCAEAFGWKRTTAYTKLKRLCDRGIFANENGTVTVLIPREDFLASQGQLFIDENFHGSLPMFLAAFSRKRRLSSQEIAQLRQLIAEYPDPEEGSEERKGAGGSHES